MKLVHLFLSFLIATSSVVYAVDIVPKPVESEKLSGTYTLSKDSVIVQLTPLAENAVSYLQGKLSDASAYTLGKGVGGNQQGAIVFALEDADGTLPEEGYHLQITSEKVELRAKDREGFFYGAVTLLQLMPKEIWQSAEKKSVATWSIPCVNITDYPRFAWRGMMLDVARNFHEKEYVKLFIDRMAQLKMNVFHWHLSDDEGWRIEIKKYPKLVEVGARRGPGTQLPFEMLPGIHGIKDVREEGYYTQADIKEIVAYAAERCITILPEVDFPGHAKAAIVSYPHLLQDPKDTSSYKSVQNVQNNTVDAGLESTYTFMDDVFKEIAELFPCAYIHVGGDERPKGSWVGSPSVKRLMEKENLKNLDEVQGYFFRRLEKILKKYDRNLIGWAEVMHGNKLQHKSSAIMSWESQEAGIHAAKTGRYAVMAPAQYVYYDLRYEMHDAEPGLFWAGVTTTQKSYTYDPMPKELKGDEKQFIKGVHGCLWSETLVTRERTNYMLWPRLYALAELAWTPQEQREWDDFSRRVFELHIPKLVAQEITPRIPTPVFVQDGEKVRIQPPFKGAEVRYTLDGSKPDKQSPVYSTPFIGEDLTRLHAKTFLHGMGSRTVNAQESLDQAKKKKK